MKLRVSSVLLCVLYVAVACGFGLVHDHHEHACPDGHDDDCAACQWQANTASDAPVVAVPVTASVRICFRDLPAFVPVTPESPFRASTASRAPPVTSA
jgi:hypothetical protein